MGWSKSTAGEAIFPNGEIAVLILCKETNMGLASKRPLPSSGVDAEHTERIKCFAKTSPLCMESNYLIMRRLQVLDMVKP